MTSYSNCVEQTLSLDETALARALDEQEIAVYYQPVMSRSATDWRIDSVEAFLRWEHPDHGMLVVDDLLPVREDPQLLQEFTELAMLQGLAQIEQWRSIGLRLKLRINLPARLLSNPKFPKTVRSVLNRASADPSNMIFEINQAANLKEHSPAIDALMHLRTMGAQLSIDEIGAGSETLPWLLRLPFGEMKLDTVSIQTLRGTPDGDFSADTIMGLAHTFGLDICGVGVESTRALNYLHRLGCAGAQGFLFSPILPPRRMLDVFRKWQAENPPVNLEKLFATAR